jgi:hypothetical protein
MNDWDIDDLVMLFCVSILAVLFVMLYLEYV